MKSLNFCFFFLVLTCYLSGCNSEQQVFSGFNNTNLNSRQKQDIIEYVRMFVTHSRIPLSQREKSIINNVTPKTIYYYDARGKGHIKIKWRLNKHKTILIRGTGPLVQKQKCNWVVSILFENKDIYQHRGLKMRKPHPKKDRK